MTHVHRLYILRCYYQLQYINLTMKLCVYTSCEMSFFPLLLLQPADFFISFFCWSLSMLLLNVGFLILFEGVQSTWDSIIFKIEFSLKGDRVCFFEFFFFQNRFAIFKLEVVNLHIFSGARADAYTQFESTKNLCTTLPYCTMSVPLY